jgi:hypothetical protein
VCVCITEEFSLCLRELSDVGFLLSMSNDAYCLRLRQLLCVSSFRVRLAWFSFAPVCFVE